MTAGQYVGLLIGVLWVAVSFWLAADLARHLARRIRHANRWIVDR